MSIEISVTVKSTNHGGEIVFTKTADSSNGLGSFDSDFVRKNGPGLVEEIARQLDNLTG